MNELMGEYEAISDKLQLTASANQILIALSSFCAPELGAWALI